MSLPPRAAWVLARLLGGLCVDGELADLPEPWNQVAEHLAGLEVRERQIAVAGMLSLFPDRDELMQMIVSVDRNGPPPPRENANTAYGVVMTCAADIESLPVEWLWKPRVPRGMITMFAGDPKLGKSFVTIYLAACVSRGAPLPHDNRDTEPGSVVLLSAEDDPARTIVPRLKAAGAIMGKVHLLEGVIREDGQQDLPSLRTDLDRIGRAISQFGDTRLVIIDPITAYLGGIDDHRNNELRAVLSPLKCLAGELNIAVVLVSHLNKSATTNAKYRVTGSIAYTGAARANFLFVRDKKDESGRRALMLDAGGNQGEPALTLAFKIEDKGNGPEVVWEPDPVLITVDQALEAERSIGSREGGRKIDPEEEKEADRWLLEVLAGGPVRYHDVINRGRENGFSKDQLKRAKGRIGAATQRDGFGPGSKCFWAPGAGSQRTTT